MKTSTTFEAKNFKAALVTEPGIVTFAVRPEVRACVVLATEDGVTSLMVFDTELHFNTFKQINKERAIRYQRMVEG